MFRRRNCLVPLLLVMTSVFGTHGLRGQDSRNSDELPAVPASLFAMSARVDEQLDERLGQEGWQPAGASSDATFLRRARFDLTGVPPTASEVIDFVKDAGSDKRNRLIESLLRSPASAKHLAETWAGWMLPEGGDLQLDSGRQGLQRWLRDRFAENLRYDRLVADLLVSRGPPQSGPTAFFVSLEGKPEKIAAKTARVFLGLQLDCAQCHDHPFDHWKQTDFWGLAAYFAQLSIDSEAAMQFNAEVSDTDQGDVTLPGSERVVSPAPLVQTGYSHLTTGTRRQQLTLWLTAPENPFMARAAVNRVWSLLFGRGLIEPVDDMRSLEMASHPQLLSELSEYFASSGYDLRNLLHMLAMTRAYSRAGLHESGLPPENSYAILPAKPLTETQLAAQLAYVARQLSGEAGEVSDAALKRQLGKLRGDGGEAKLGMVSALVTLHGEAFNAVSSDGQSRLLKALQAPHLDARGQVRWLFLSTLSREPTSVEMQALSQLNSGVEGGGDATESPLQWQSDLLWALINSTEFAMTP